MFEHTLADLGNALKKHEMPFSTILSHPLKLEGEVKVQAFNDQTLRVKLDHIHFYSNGTEVSLTNAHQILDTERSNGGLMGPTAQIFENSLIAPFMVLTKGGVLKKMVVSMNEPAEVTEIKKMLAFDLEMKTNQAQLRLVMKKAFNTTFATPRFPTKVDLGNCILIVFLVLTIFKCYFYYLFSYLYFEDIYYLLMKSIAVWENIIESIDI